MGTIATLVAIGPDRLVVDLYVAGHALAAVVRWLRRFKIDSISIGGRFGDEHPFEISVGAKKKGSQGHRPTKERPKALKGKPTSSAKPRKKGGKGKKGKRRAHRAKG